MISYSQPATKQDHWVLKRFASQGQYGRDFIEIGAHDGHRHSNTRLMEEMYGWRGVLVEANPELAKQCAENRPQATTVQAAIAPGYMSSGGFYLGGSYGGLTSFMPGDFAKEHLFRKTPTTTVSCMSLQKLLEICKQPKYVDYLSLDVEGAEYAILHDFIRSGMDTQFGIITVEFRYDKLLLNKLEDLLQGYTLEHVEAWDAFFVNKHLNKKRWREPRLFVPHNSEDAA
jgi:FkbM family methyltransferase